jgi:hypothetical protein
MFLSLGYKSMVDLIFKAQRRIYLALPSVHSELADALVERSKLGNVDIRAVIALSEDNIRNGYGDLKAVEVLNQNGIPLLDSGDSLVSFFICDGVGYYIFPQSRIFSAGDTGLNAVVIDPVSIVSIIHHFFPSTGTVEMERLETMMTEAIDLSVEYCETALNDIQMDTPDLAVTPVNAAKYREIKENIERNPPKNPDLLREIKIFSSRIQFVEMVFEGANLHQAKVDYPAQALPFHDQQLKALLDAKIHVFSELLEKKGFSEFAEYRNEVEQVRREFLPAIGSRKKGVLDLRRKGEFEKEIARLKKRAKELNSTLIVLLQKEILDAKKRIRAELGRFLRENPTTALKAFRDQEALFEESVDDVVETILRSIRYPNPERLASRITLTVHFYDVTFDDFQDEKFLEELEKKQIMEKGDISGIVRISKAYEAKR